MLKIVTSRYSHPPTEGIHAFNKTCRCWFRGGYQGGVLDPDFLWKMGHILKSSKKLSIFPIPNFPPSHSVEFFVFYWELLRAFFKTVIIEHFPRKIVPGYDRAYQGGVEYRSLGKNRICVLSNITRLLCPDITRSFHIFPVYRIEKLGNSWYRRCIASRFPQF